MNKILKDKNKSEKLDDCDIASSGPEYKTQDICNTCNKYSEYIKNSDKPVRKDQNNGQKI